MPTRLEHREFTDPEELSEALPGRSGRFKALARGAFRAELTIGALGCVTLQCATETLARVAYHAMPAGRVGILGWPRGGKLPIVRGMQMRAGELLSIGGCAESYHRTSESVDYVALSVDANELSLVAVDLAGRELRAENGLVRLTPSLATAKLVSTLDRARDVARAAPELFESAEAARALEQSLLHAAVASLADSAPRNEPSADARRARIMARFEAVVEANAARPLHVPELCRLVGVPERTLRKCCQQHLGMSPHQYLLRRRIQLVRRALLRGDPASESVTSIATNHGFWELGRFAGMYRSLFGEAPSATLRRDQTGFA